jgi:1-deoxy-D-xylulose-5-phosphate reductoisomerase
MFEKTHNKSKGIAILGSTGSIGVNTLNVIRCHPKRFHVVALAANRDVPRMVEQCAEFLPKIAVLVESDKASQLQYRLKNDGVSTRVLAGSEALQSVASLPEVDYVMAAIVGAAGLLPSLAAARSGKRVLLANKESLVMSGELFMKTVRDNHAELLPIDSEHNAVFQCLPVGFENGLSEVGVNRILLTASGGPFRTTPLDKLHAVTPAQACAHPNWAMGRKISVDSATMMNKGLEIIEACRLFNAQSHQVEVLLHPQSVIHSMVAYEDGSVLAQLGNPDMRTPIAHALAWPERMSSGVQPLDLVGVSRLDFQEPDMQRFPCLRLAREALEAGGTATAILNAANEVAVDYFLREKIAFTDIPRVIEKTLESVEVQASDSLEIVLRADSEARRFSREYIATDVSLN